MVRKEVGKELKFKKGGQNGTKNPGFNSMCGLAGLSSRGSGGCSGKRSHSNSSRRCRPQSKAL